MAPTAPAPETLPSHCVTRALVRVRFCDTDMMGIVHHSNYITYFELARIEYLRRRGLTYAAFTKTGFHLPVISAEARYLRPAHLDDILGIEARLVELSRVKVGFAYRVLRAGTAGDELLATGHTLLACVDDQHRPVRMPREAGDLLLAPETGGGELQL
jgi:acyl-CoA thioester hydrolase